MGQGHGRTTKYAAGYVNSSYPILYSLFSLSFFFFFCLFGFF